MTAKKGSIRDPSSDCHWRYLEYTRPRSQIRNAFSPDASQESISTSERTWANVSMTLSEWMRGRTGLLFFFARDDTIAA